MFSLPTWLANITLGQLLVLATLGTPISGGVYWGLDKMIKSAVAGERFATQEALDAQGMDLKLLQKQITDLDKQSGIMQSDLGTVKQLQKEAKEDTRMILLGITKLQQD